MPEALLSHNPFLHYTVDDLCFVVFNFVVMYLLFVTFQTLEGQINKRNGGSFV